MVVGRAPIMHGKRRAGGRTFLDIVQINCYNIEI